MTFLFRSFRHHYKKLTAVFRLAVWLCLFAALPACEKDISSSVTIDTEPQLVVSAFISPQDSVLQVKVSQSRPVIGIYPTGEEAEITNATVKLSQGGRTITFTYSATPGRWIYEADPTSLPILPGQTYTLVVTTPDGHQVTAACTVPTVEGVTISDLKLSARKATMSDGHEYDEHTFSYKWQDAPGVENFYQTLTEKESKDPQTNNLVRYQLYNNDDLFTDERKDGQTFAASERYQVFPGQPNPKPYNLHVCLAVTDRAYYLYHQSIKKQQETNGNPFAEPVLIYSNVTGGIGIFSAYNQIKATLKVE